jgi:hypothetical protein
MGVETAKIIRDQQLRHVEIPFSLTMRSSL